MKPTTPPPAPPDVRKEMQPSKSQPVIVILVVLTLMAIMIYITYIERPIDYTVSICTNSRCSTAVVKDVRVDGSKITIYKNRFTNRVKQIIVLNRNQNATVTPIYR